MAQRKRILNTKDVEAEITRTVALLREINSKLIKKSKAMTIAPVLLNLPVRPESEIESVWQSEPKELRAKKLSEELGGLSSALQRTIELAKESYLLYRQKAQLYYSPSELARFIVEEKGMEEKVDEALFLNQYFMFVPAIIVGLPKGLNISPD